MNIDEFIDLYVENSFHVRWTEIEFYHDLGMILSEVQDLKPYAKSIKKHESFLKTCVEFYRKYPNLNSAPFGKDISWSRIKKEFQTEKRSRKPLKILIEQRKKEHEYLLESRMFLETEDFVKGKLEEDKELLEELDAK